MSVLGIGQAKLVFPILSRLVPGTGNRNKLKIALALVRALAPAATKPIRVLFDAWFMRARLVLPLLRRNCHVIGQARYDTALFLPPEVPAGKRLGRPRKYGQRLTSDMIAALPTSTRFMFIYSKNRTIRLRSVVVVARFIKATPVRAVWCEFFDSEKNTWSKPRLLLATETELHAETIVCIYSRRWGVEPLFYNLKNWWGIDKLWQQSRQVLELSLIHI